MPDNYVVDMWSTNAGNTLNSHIDFVPGTVTITSYSPEKSTVKITNGGVGINLGEDLPTEDLQLGRTARFLNLPKNGGFVHTTPEGTRSNNPSPDQPFNADKTLVADKNGVLGYVEGLLAINNLIVANSGFTLSDAGTYIIKTNSTVTLPGDTTSNGTKVKICAANQSGASTSITVNSGSGTTIVIPGTAASTSTTVTNTCKQFEYDSTNKIWWNTGM